MKVQVQIKNVYGVEKIYPACETAKLLCQLHRTITFTEDAIAVCKKLGYEFEIVQHAQSYAQYFKD